MVITYLDDGAGALGDGQGRRLLDDVLLALEGHGRRLRAVRRVLAHDLGGGDDSAVVTRGDEAGEDGEDDSGASEHDAGLFGSCGCVCVEDVEY